jgi:adenylate kinase family enzyme
MADEIMKAGKLFPDDLMSQILGNRLDEPDTANGVIFDGYPRTGAQAESLDELLGERGRHLDHVIELSVDEQALVDRITGRFSCTKCGEGYHDRYKLPKSRAFATSAAMISSSAGPMTMQMRCARGWPSIAPRPHRSCPCTRRAGS